MFQEKMVFQVSEENRAIKNQTGKKERILGFIVKRGHDKGQRCNQKVGSST